MDRELLLKYLGATGGMFGGAVGGAVGGEELARYLLKKGIGARNPARLGRLSLIIGMIGGGIGGEKLGIKSADLINQLLRKEE